MSERVMSPERFREAEAVFLAAVARPGPERADFVRELCGSDADLREHVLDLIAHDADTHMDPAGVGAAVRGAAESLLRTPPPEPPHPARIGSYRIIRPIGEGAFGIVYLAEQENPRRTVAIKVLRTAFASGEVARRFEFEAFILARLRHPGIAQIFEAGAAQVRVHAAAGPDVVSSQPFLVMEYVEGPNLVEYARSGGGPGSLGTRERIELVARVCDAVQHAHQNGVIHRDLKPDNILVSEFDVPAGDHGSKRPGARLRRAQPKVVDFGVARIMEAEAGVTLARTGAGRVMGTLAYMSPEQVSGESRLVDTRSDIYSLGVLLYQVLTGKLPYAIDGLNLPDAMRVIREREPGPFVAAPETLPIDRSLRVDAEAIVRKALAKDRGRRYASVAELGADLRRLLTGEPVAAKRDSAWYVVRKTLRRHRVALAVASLFAALLVGSSVVGWSLYVSAQRARTRATDLLRDLYVSEARATRTAGGIGRRFGARASLQKAADIRMGPDLRDEAAAGLALTDLVLEREIPWAPVATARGLSRIDRVATADVAGTVRVYDLETGRETGSFDEPGEAPALMRFSPEGEYIAAGYRRPDRGEAIWVRRVPGGDEVVRLTDEQTRWRFTMGTVQGQTLLAWLEVRAKRTADVVIAELPSMRRIVSFAVHEDTRALAFDPSGTRLLVTGVGGAPVDIFNARTGERLVSIPVTISLWSPCWSPDGQLIGAGGSDFGAHLWDAATGAPLRTLQGHRGAVTDAWFGHGGPMVTTGWDGTTRLWDAATGEAVLSPLTDGDCVGSDGRRLVIQSGRAIRVMRWHADTPVTVLRIDGPLGPLSTTDFLPDGRVAIAGDCGISVMDPASGERMNLDTREARCAFVASGLGLVGAIIERDLLTWPIPTPGSAPAPARVAWSGVGHPWGALHPDGRRVIITNAATLAVDLLTGEETRLADAYVGMERPAVSPDGRWLFSGTWQGDPARVLDLRSGRSALAFDRRSVRGSISPDGQWIGISLPGLFRLYRIGEWRTPRTLDWPDGTVDLAGASAFSHDGTLLAATVPPHEIRLVDTATGITLLRLPNPGHLGVTDLRFSPDGRVLAVTTLEREVLLWDIPALRRGLREAGLDWQPW